MAKENHFSDEILDRILKYNPSPEVEKEMSRFKMWDVSKYVTLFQDFNSFGVGFSLSHSVSDEHNWLIHIDFLFWKAELSWEFRK